MFSAEEKHRIAVKVQTILQETYNKELPKGEIQFILHVDGATPNSWANVRNNGAHDVDIPEPLIRNMSVFTLTDDWVATFSDPENQNGFMWRMAGQWILPEGVDPTDERVIALCEKAKGKLARGAAAPASSNPLDTSDNLR